MRDVAPAVRQEFPEVDAHVAPAEGERLEELAGAGIDDLRAQFVYWRGAIGAACARNKH